ncbi:M24 family metallopeptidase [Microbacterium trichothecenolyticum]|uniref:Xaa-Pro dipeptidase n=1 Tax=Microbacterium trichothecenolyticum TaxID=69370 RepID=A0ABU0TWL9_MICTR|nr:M24 family metallopeptidase [Microbacterium trichothecenolyticum]MDQ1124063.1 Xaa-Pro dipeptidase [Microbacterium trichothecenolyticum]
MTDRSLTDEPPEGLVRAQRLAIRIAEEFARDIEPGESERAVRDRIDRRVVELGGAGVWTPTVVGFGVGTLSCFPTDVPSERVLWNIDLGTIDVHPVTTDGWWGDCTRTLIRGENVPQRRALEAVEEIHAGLLAAARPGMRACDWFAHFQDALSGTGLLLLDRLQNIGHSLSRDSSYDDGYIDAYNETVMTGAWAVEPFIGTHLYGVKREDVVWFGPRRVTVIS